MTEASALVGLLLAKAPQTRANWMERKALV